MSLTSEQIAAYNELGSIPLQNVTIRVLEYVGRVKIYYYNTASDIDGHLKDDIWDKLSTKEQEAANWIVRLVFDEEL